MGYVYLTSACYACHQPFSYHPNKVPSIRVPGLIVDGAPLSGPREPICRSCMDFVNEVRVRDGLPPHPIQPGAYEPADEAEVDWGES